MHRAALMLALVGAGAGCGAAGTVAEEYDIVIANGRVIDPESGLDAIRHVGIRDGRIAAISETPLTGFTAIDATDRIVGPGFIDLHAHGQDEENNRFQAMDGVTSALELEVGTDDVAAWYAAREGRSLLNHGVSVGHVPVRMRVLNDGGTFLPRGAAAHRAATDSELQAVLAGLERGLREGAVAVGFGLQYTPAASRWEVLEAFGVAGRFAAPAHVHLRHMGEREPVNSIMAAQEVIAAAALTATPLHIVHVQSSGLRATPRLLRMIELARERGLDITTEAYPYTAGMTRIESAIFDEGWQEVLGIGHADLEWAASGERLTPASFARYRDSGGMVILHFIPPEIVELAIASPLTIIASDGRLQAGRGHPRSTGTYARILGRYVRDAGVLSWIDAFRKMSLMPAQRLEKRVPEMASKGRLRVGADADIVVIHPDSVLDRSSYAEPAVASAGIEHVLVNGVPVVRAGVLQTDVAPGRPIRAPTDRPLP